MDKNKTLTEAANDLIEHAMEQGIPGRMIPFVEALRVAKNERKAESDAARQEIASLKAQPYDQQAMGLCHACGWKGVLDYPDGPVCVACEHDKTLPPQPTAQALHVAATSCPHEIDKDKIVLHFDSKQPGKNALAQLAARLQAAQAQAVPAPGVEAVSEREFKQFLSDVITAAGLVTHGKKCKDLGRRLGEMSMRLLTAPKTAAAPTQAGEYPAGTGNQEADRIIGRLASSDPDFDDCADAVALIHKLVAEIKGPDGFDTWKDAAIADRAASSVYSRAMDLVRVFWQQHTQADALSMTMAELHTDVELVIRAARGSAQAAPVDAESWLDLLAEARAALWQPANAALCERLDAFIDAARAAQKGGA